MTYKIDERTTLKFIFIFSMKIDPIGSLVNVQFFYIIFLLHLLLTPMIFTSKELRES